MTTSGEKPNEDGVEKQASASTPSGNENAANIKSPETADTSKPIKRVKANKVITKTVLDVDAYQNNTSELFGDGKVTPEAIKLDESPSDSSTPISKQVQPPPPPAKPVQPPPAPKPVQPPPAPKPVQPPPAPKPVQPPPAPKPVQPLPSPEPATAAVTNQPAQEEQRHVLIQDGAPGLEPSLSPIKRVKANEAIARTKLDLDACRDVAFNTVEVQAEKFKELIESQPAVPIKEFQPIDKYRNASPCSSSWETMTGATGCMKFCEKCQLLVYDFSSVELAQAEQIIFQREDKEQNFILYRRKDGKFLTRDCPVGAGRRQFSIVALAVSMLFVTGGAIYLMCQPHPKEVVAMKVVQPPVQPIVPNPNLVAAIEQPPEPEEPRVATSLPKTKFSFDKARYVKQIKFLKDKGTDTTKYEKALYKIEQDIDAGKHRYYIEPQLEELGLSVGLIKRQVVVTQKENGVITDIRHPSRDGYSKTGFAVGFRRQLPKAAAEVDAYNATSISDDTPLHITDLIPGSTAGKAGLRVGYRILEINGTSVDGLTIPEVQSMLKEAGNNVAIGVQIGPSKMKTVMLGRPAAPAPSQ